MMRVLMLLLPGVIPSWAFFKSVEPSPRVQWRVLTQAGDGLWCPYRPRPQTVTPLTMIKRLFWNPDWNDTLFMVSLAERLMEEPTDHSLREIQARLARDFIAQFPADIPLPALEFRLMFVHREGARMVEEITYVSTPWAPQHEL